MGPQLQITLGHAGHRAVSCRSAERAGELARNERGPPSRLLLDFVPRGLREALERGEGAGHENDGEERRGHRGAALELRLVMPPLVLAERE